MLLRLRLGRLARQVAVGGVGHVPMLSLLGVRARGQPPPARPAPPRRARAEFKCACTHAGAGTNLAQLAQMDGGWARPCPVVTRPGPVRMGADAAAGAGAGAGAAPGGRAA
eukprot:SAG31_NODE_2504_length_5592_cov_3.052977_1_plen_110_part_10